jgi:hypothetical protein
MMGFRQMVADVRVPRMAEIHVGVVPAVAVELPNWHAVRAPPASAAGPIARPNPSETTYIKELL